MEIKGEPIILEKTHEGFVLYANKNGHLFKEQYIGYPKSEAIRRFKRAWKPK